MHIIINELGPFRKDFFAKIFSEMLPSVTTLRLTIGELGHWAHSDLIKNFSNMPDTVEELQLAIDNNIECISNCPTQDIVNILTHTPRSCKKIYLINDLKYGYANLPGGDLTRIFSAISVAVLEVQLNNNYAFEDGTLITALGSLPDNVTFLNFSSCSLGAHMTSGLSRILKAIHPSVNTLSLANNGFWQFGDEDEEDDEVCLEALTKMPPTIVSLDLSRNHLIERDNTDHFIATAPGILRKIPLTVKALKFSMNNLGNIPIVELITILQAIPVGVASLDLNGNHLYKLGTDLVTVLAVIPGTVKFINLRGNKLERLPAKTLNDVILLLAKRTRKLGDSLLTLQEMASLSLLKKDGLWGLLIKEEVTRLAYENLLRVASLITGVSTAHIQKMADALAATTPILQPGLNQHVSIFTRRHDQGGGGAAERSGGKHQRDASDDMANDPKAKRLNSG